MGAAFSQRACAHFGLRPAKKARAFSRHTILPSELSHPSPSENHGRDYEHHRRCPLPGPQAGPLRVYAPDAAPAHGASGGFYLIREGLDAQGLSLDFASELDWEVEGFDEEVAAALFGEELDNEHRPKQQRLALADAAEEQDTRDIEEFLSLFDALQEERSSASGDSYDSPAVSCSPSADEPVAVFPQHPSNFSSYNHHLHHLHHLQPELQVQQQQLPQPFLHVPTFSPSLASSIPVVSASGVQAPLDAAAKREYRKQSIERWMRKRERRRWIKGATYSRRSEVAVRRPRDNGKFVKSNVRFLTMSELEQQAQL